MLLSILFPIFALMLASDRTTDPTFDDFTFLSGDWKAGDEAYWRSETWVGVSNEGVMKGSGMTVVVDNQRAKVHRQDMRLWNVPREGWKLFVIPRGSGTMIFEPTDIGPNRVTFEAPENDYPQKITYSRDNDVLKKTSSMLDGSKALTWEFRLQ